MTDEQKGGVALVVGAAGGLVTMALHPTGRDLMAPGHAASMAALAAAVHTLAIACLPVSFLGALALTRRLAAPGRLALPVAALVVYGFALVAAMAAAVLSGFVATRLAREILAGTPQEGEGLRLLIHFGWLLNQAFAQVFAVASATALALWSAAIVRTRALPRGLGVYGLVLGPVVALAVLAGHLRLDVHGFGLVMLGEGIWLLVAGGRMWRGPASLPAAPVAPTPGEPAPSP
jgi:hypothetical protein